MRIYELAKQLGVHCNDLLQHLPALGIGGKVASSSLNQDQVQAVKAALSNGALTSTTPPAGTNTMAEDPPSEGGGARLEEDAGKETAPVSNESDADGASDTGALELKFPIGVKDFAEKIGMKPNQLIAELMGMNIFASINEKLDLKVAQQVGAKHGLVIEQEKKHVEKKQEQPKPKIKPVAEEDFRTEGDDRPQDLLPRPPVVTFMGHVDHGKTSLMDNIRKTRVAAGEAGGITQHIGAYQVTHNQRVITFMDTPGHAAFTKMRARGANMTDIAVIVVAADDGVMPQTREAIQHAKAADVAIIVAINKMDLRTANPDRVKRQLQQEGLVPEDWGGEVLCCPVSAQTGEGVDHLLEMILLQADMLELKANPRRLAQGYVIESKLEPGMGPTAHILVSRGTLRTGDTVVCGPHWGRVRALINDRAETVKSCGPSAAVKLLGLSGVPEPGDEFIVHTSEKTARKLSEERLAARRLDSIQVVQPKRMTMDQLLNASQEKGRLELRVVLKADTQGSLEAIAGALSGIKSDKVEMKILMQAVGNVSVNDVLLANASKAVILGFHVSKDNGVGAAAKREGVEIRLYSIIYEMLDDVKVLMSGLLEPLMRERVLGHAEVRQVFDLSKRGAVAGCVVKSGRVTARGKARILRAGDVLFAGQIASLRRFQNDASEVREGQECGLRVDGFSEYQVGDTIECYDIEKIAQQL